MLSRHGPMWFLFQIIITLISSMFGLLLESSIMSHMVKLKAQKSALHIILSHVIPCNISIETNILLQ